MFVTLLVACGGLLAMDLRPGRTLLVSGTTGGLSSATLALAPPIGARNGRPASGGRLPATEAALAL